MVLSQINRCVFLGIVMLYIICKDAIFAMLLLKSRFYDVFIGHEPLLISEFVYVPEPSILNGKARAYSFKTLIIITTSDNLTTQNHNKVVVLNSIGTLSAVSAKLIEIIVVFCLVSSKVCEKLYKIKTVLSYRL